MSRPRITKVELEKIARRCRELHQDSLFPGVGSDTSDLVVDAKGDSEPTA